MSLQINRRPVNDIATNTAQLPAQLHPKLKQIYAARGISEASQLERGVKSLLHYQQRKFHYMTIQELFSAAVPISAAIACYHKARNLVKEQHCIAC